MFYRRKFLGKTEKAVKIIKTKPLKFKVPEHTKTGVIVIGSEDILESKINRTEIEEGKKDEIFWLIYGSDK